MAALKDIKRRIQAVKSTQKMTRAMKLVAAARLKRAQQTAFDARSYSSGIIDTAMLVSRRLGPRAPLMWQRPKDLNCVDLAVVTSDRGLCGGFNENLLRRIEEAVTNAASHNIDTRLYVIGKKGMRYLSARGRDVEAVPGGDDAGVASWIAARLMERYRKGESAGGNVAFNRFASAGRQELTFWNLLPLHKRGNAKERHLEYLYEPTRETALDRLCAMAITASMRQAILESRAAELAARMSAMDNATRNADDMIAHLTFVYNRARQEDITSELMDIVGGAEALK
ncbi:MAG: ATP synthase F1 subunit gamma [Pseudomonadota bacterium]